MNKKLYRPSPFPEHDSDVWLQQFEHHLNTMNWYASKFKFWRILHLVKNRNKCSLIMLHWPEGFWRSSSVFICYIKALYFIFIFFISRFFGYKWVWVSHNCMPHYLVISNWLEKKMRHFIIAQFDLIIGPSYNSEDDLINEFGSSGNNFIQAFVCDERGKYNPNKTRNEILSQLNIPKNSKIILCMNSLYRKNKGVDDLLDSWISRKKKNKNIYFVLTGIKPKQYEDLRKDEKFRFIEGKLSEQCLSNLFSAINFLFLNYKSITNSGQFFLALNYSVPVIAPNLTFFDRHSNNKSAILFDKELELKLQIDDILESIDHGWSADLASMNSLNDRYNPKNSIKKISTYLNKLT